MKMRFTILTFLFLAVVSSNAQTEYDIQVFFDNIPNERPKREDLEFYLSAGKKLFGEGRKEESNIFFDFAASVGSPEGFKGKAMSENGPLKERHLLFAHKKTVSARKLLRALAHADSDLKSALLVKDNIASYGLVFLENPLVGWAPSTAADTLYLKKHDDVAFEIAQLKEASGRRLEAIYLYELAAMEGNYEALLKVQDVGFDSRERKIKEFLVERMNNEKQYVALHKYFAHERMTPEDYGEILDFLKDKNELLISLALGIHEPEEETLKERVINSFLQVYKSRENDPIIENRGDYYYEGEKSVVSSAAMRGFSRKQSELLNILKNQNRELDLGTRKLNGEYKGVSVENQITLLRMFSERLKDYEFSSEAVSFIKRYIESNPEPWSSEVTTIISGLVCRSDIPRKMEENPLYRAYESGLLGKLHHTQKRTPKIVKL